MQCVPVEGAEWPCACARSPVPVSGFPNACLCYWGEQSQALSYGWCETGGAWYVASIPYMVRKSIHIAQLEGVSSR